MTLHDCRVPGATPPAPRTHCRPPRAATTSVEPITGFAFLGSSVTDAQVARDVIVETFEDGIELSRPGEPYSHFIATDACPRPGAKVTARRPIRLDVVGRYIDDVRPGGGGLNQTLAFVDIARRHGKQVHIRLFDTAQSSPDVAQACAARGVRLISLARHRSSVNLVVELRQPGGLQEDRLVVRSPLELLPGNHHEPNPADRSPASCLAVISPKDASAIAGILKSKPAQVYFQSTGSLDLEITRDLISLASAVVTNFDELGKLAASCKIPWTGVNENAPDAPQIAKDTWHTLQLHGVFPRDVGVTTLGRSGCVVVDFQKKTMHHHRLEVRNGHAVGTRNGSGDRWLAEYLFVCQVEQMSEPRASCEATARVAGWLGLADDDFNVETDDLSALPEFASS